MRERNDWTIGGKARHGGAAGGRWTALRERMLDGLAALLMLGLLGAGLLMPRTFTVEGLLRDTLAKVALPFGQEALQQGKAALAALFDGDVPVHGAAEEVRALPGFARLEVHGGALRVMLRPGVPQVRVEGAEALRAQVRTEVEGGLLRVFVPPAAEGEVGVGVELSAPALEEVSAASASTVDVVGAEAEALAVEARGGSRVRARGLRVVRLAVVASGGGTVELEGAGAEAMHARAAGGGVVLAAGLPVRALEVSGSGAARVEVNAASRVEARMAGASSLVVHGHPDERLVLASRGARVRWQ